MPVYAGAGTLVRTIECVLHALLSCDCAVQCSLTALEKGREVCSVSKRLCAERRDMHGPLLLVVGTASASLCVSAFGTCFTSVATLLYTGNTYPPIA